MKINWHCDDDSVNKPELTFLPLFVDFLYESRN